MIAASFYVLWFWICVLLIGCVVIAAFADWSERRDRRRRIRRLKERRQHLDSLEPKRWTT